MTDFIKTVLFLRLYCLLLSVFGLLLMLVTFLAGNVEAFLVLTIALTLVPCTKIIYDKVVK